MELLSGVSFNLLRQGMDAVWKKQMVTMQNLANIETPGYKAKYVDFETVFTLLRDETGTTSKIVPELRTEVKVDTSTSMRLDGNNVDENRESIELARAQIQYDYLQSKISNRINMLEHVITEGKK